MLREIFNDILPVIVFTGGSITLVFIVGKIKTTVKNIIKLKRALESLKMNECTFCTKEQEKTVHPAR